MIWEHPYNRITNQFRRYEADTEVNKKKKQIKSMENDRQKKVVEIIRKVMSSEERIQSYLNLQTIASSWLTMLFIKEEEYILNKQISGIYYLSDMAGDWNEFPVTVIVPVVVLLIYKTLSSVQKMVL